MYVAKNTHTEERYLPIIASKIKRLRIDRGYSSYEVFALENNFDRKQYWRIENGSNITMITLTKVLDALEIPLTEFFSDLEEL